MTMLRKYSAPFLVAVALAGSPLAAQIPAERELPAPVQPVRPVQPSAQSLVRQPSNLELQVQITELRQEVAALNALLTRLGQREADRYWALIRVTLHTCRAALYVANPDLSDPDDECLSEFLPFDVMGPRDP